MKEEKQEEKVEEEVKERMRGRSRRQWIHGKEQEEVKESVDYR